MKLNTSLVLIFSILAISIPASYQQIAGYSYAAQNQWSATCLSASQSPISLVGASITEGSEKSFIKIQNFAGATGTADVIMTNQQSILYYNCAKGWFTWYAPTSTGNYTNFTSTSLQVHAPAEHQFDDQRVLEFQFRGTSTDGTNGVVVLSFALDDSLPENPLVKPFADAITNATTTFSIDIHSLLFNQIDHMITPSVLMYSGSDTQPPCSSNFNWYIVQQAGYITSAQLKQFAPYSGSARNSQPVNGRQITKLGSLQVQKSAANLMVPFLAILALIFTLMFF